MFEEDFSLLEIVEKYMKGEISSLSFLAIKKCRVLNLKGLCLMIPAKICTRVLEFDFNVKKNNYYEIAICHDNILIEHYESIELRKYVKNGFLFRLSTESKIIDLDLSYLVFLRKILEG